MRIRSSSRALQQAFRDQLFLSNQNGIPDAEGDLWIFRAEKKRSNGLVLAFSTDIDDARRLAIFKMPPDKNLSDLILDERGGAAGDRFAKALDD